jgi:Glycosyltransferase family 87
MTSKAQEDDIKPSSERVIRLAAVAAVVSIILGAAIFSLPVEKTNDTRDFSEFYCAAQIVTNGLGTRLYDIGLQSQFISRVAAVHTFYNHPPFESLVFVPLTIFSYPTAFRIWTLVNLTLLVVAAWLVESRMKVSLAVSQWTGIHADFGLVLVLFLTFAPATTSLLIGQDSMLMLFVYTVVFVLLRRSAQFAAGCVLALGLFKFQLVLPFALILTARRKWSFLIGFLTIGGLLVLISITISGFQVLSGYPRFLLFDSSYQQVAGFQPEFMPNIRGIVYLLLNRWIRSSSLNILVLVLSVFTMWFAAKKWRDEQFGLSFSTAVIATLLTSYHLYNYDVTLLLLSLAIACSELGQQKRLRTSSPLLPGVLIVILIHPLHTVLVKQSIYALMFVPIFVLYLLICRMTEFVPEEPK